MKDYKTVEPEIPDYLSQLNKTEIEQVIELYHGKELTINGIIEKFGLDKITPSHFKNHLPPVIETNNICPECETLSWVSHTCRGLLSNPFCPVCEQWLSANFNPESRLWELKHEKEMMTWEPMIDVDFYGNEVSIDQATYDSLDFETKVVLGCMVSIAAAEDLTHIKGQLLKYKKLFPSYFDSEQALMKLTNSTYIPFDIRYNIEPTVIKQLLLPQDRLNSSPEEQYLLWKKIVLAETKEMLNWRSELYSFHISQSDLVDEILGNLLESHSLGQLYHIIWLAVAKATDCYAQTNNRFMSANSIIHNCKRTADYFHANDKVISIYNRPSQCEQSELSRYYFNSILQIGQNGFCDIPSLPSPQS